MFRLPQNFEIDEVFASWSVAKTTGISKFSGRQNIFNNWTGKLISLAVFSRSYLINSFSYFRLLRVVRIKVPCVHSGNILELSLPSIHESMHVFLFFLLLSKMPCSNFKNMICLKTKDFPQNESDRVFSLKYYFYQQIQSVYHGW